MQAQLNAGQYERFEPDMEKPRPVSLTFPSPAGRIPIVHYCMPARACSQLRAVAAAPGLQRCPGCTALIGEADSKATRFLLAMNASHPGCPARVGCSDTCSMRHAPTLCLCCRLTRSAQSCGSSDTKNSVRYRKNIFEGTAEEETSPGERLSDER